MNKLVLNGVEYTGEKFEVKDNILIVNDKNASDFKKDHAFINVNGDCDFVCDTSIIVRGQFAGGINGKHLTVKGKTGFSGLLLGSAKSKSEVLKLTDAEIAAFITTKGDKPKDSKDPKDLEEASKDISDVKKSEELKRP